ISTIIISVLSVGFSYLLKLLIDSAVDGNAAVFMNIIYLTGALVLAMVALQYLKTRMLGSYTENGLMTLRHNFAAKMNTISIDAMQSSHSGDVLSRGTNDMNRVRNFTHSLLPRLIEVPLSALLAFGVLLYLSWKLTLITLALIPVLVIGSSLLSKPIASLSRTVQHRLGLVNQTITDFIKGVEVSKAYTLEETLKSKHDKAVNESVEGGGKLAKRKAMLEAFSMVFGIIPFFVTFILGGYFVIQGEMTMGGLLAFINLLNLLTFPLSQMSVMIGEAKRDMASAERIFETIDAQDERQDGEAYMFSNTSPLIAFKDVMFTYPGNNEPIITHFNLEIDPNETVAFVGPSGGGKSTVVKLIMGYYDNYTGSLKIGGHELKDWSLPSLRENLALVSQDTFLFPESIRENISHGNENASFEAVKSAAEKAFADPFITEFEKGYDTSLGELGDSLSGGQKQRIAIARAILKDAQVLILDEATSALDTESEQMIQRALEPLLKKKTSIIIAHRLSTIRNVDRICVIDEGEIKEQGTHQELLDKGGLYYTLYNQELKKEGAHDEEENV
ncbi:MAG: ABC transporter ATP-binding protein, partial [Bacillota bacterium]